MKRKANHIEGVSLPVNPELSTIFLQLHISERPDRGVPKIINAYDREIFEFGENTISVIQSFDRIQKDALVNTPQVGTNKGIFPRKSKRISS